MADFVRKGPQAFQLPASLVFAPTTIPLNGPARRVLSWVLWDAAQQELWPTYQHEPMPIVVRRHADDIRAGVGLEAARDYRTLNAALRRLAQARLVFKMDGEQVGVPIFQQVDFLPGSHVEYVLSAPLARLHWRPLNRYALVNLEHIRRLKRPLDHLVYEHACLVARMQRPQFMLQLMDLVEVANIPSGCWSAVKRPFLGACRRVAAAVGAQLRVIAWCAGDASCADTYRILPQRLGAAAPAKRQPRSRHYLVDGRGVQRVD